jgi:hypothetical protein
MIVSLTISQTKTACPSEASTGAALAAAAAAEGTCAVGDGTDVKVASFWDAAFSDSLCRIGRLWPPTLGKVIEKLEKHRLLYGVATHRENQ